MKPRFKWRHQYDEDRDEAEGLAAALDCKDESLTVQSFTKDADLNEIARRFGINSIPTIPFPEGEAIDTTQFPDLRQILDAQREAANRFMGLPHKLRKRFHNSPKELWDFLQDPENADEAVRLGLLKRTQSSAGADATAENSSTHSTTGPANNGGTDATPENPPKDAKASK